MELALQFQKFFGSTVSTVEKQEEEMMKLLGGFNVSVSEIHILEAVGDGCGKSLSEIASLLNVSSAAATVGVSRLVKKGFLRKSRAVNDGRSMIVTLTSNGGRVNELHQMFHREITENFMKELNEREAVVILGLVEKMNQYFARNKNWRHK